MWAMKKTGAALHAVAAFAVVAAVALPRSAVAENLATVIGDVRLRQSVQEVQEQLPEMREVSGRVGGLSSVDGPSVRRFVLQGAKPFGLKKPTDMELRFWKDQLWLVIFQFGDNADTEVRAALEKRFGAKPGALEQAFWTGPDYDAALQMKPRWFSLQDPGLTAEAQRWFLEVMGRKVATPPASPAVATPAPAAGAAEK